MTECIITETDGGMFSLEFSSGGPHLVLLRPDGMDALARAMAPYCDEINGTGYGRYPTGGIAETAESLQDNQPGES
jgi:hypothetical protein